MKSKNLTSLFRKIKPKDIFRILLLAVLAAVIGLNIYALNATRLSGNPVPMPLGFGMSVVLSGSMEPELSVGDMIIVVPSDAYAIGDVVVFQSGRTAVVHRIIGIEGEEVITQGDANNAPDDPISLSAVRGKVVFTVPFVGYLVNLIKTPLGTILLLGLAIFFLESSFKKDKKQNQDELETLRKEIEQLKQEQNKQ